MYAATFSPVALLLPRSRERIVIPVPPLIEPLLAFWPRLKQDVFERPLTLDLNARCQIHIVRVITSSPNQTGGCGLWLRFQAELGYPLISGPVTNTPPF